ncbi:MAG TPA: hypothetical protein VIF62_17980 [Labilithrix sp.]|jgi:hypothetical protein
MFEDIDDGATRATGTISVSKESPDRVVVYVIWSRNEIGQLPVHEAWEVLFARYPNEPKYLLFAVYEELVTPQASHATWTPTYFLDKVQRVLDSAGGRLNPEVRDLLAVAEDELHPLSEKDGARLDRIRGRIGVRLGDSTAARKRLARLASDTVRDLHDRTEGGKSLGSASGTADYKAAIAAAKGEKKTYAATAKVAVGDLLDHPKFGLGVVTAVDPGRATILFETGARKLVCG